MPLSLEISYDFPCESSRPLGATLEIDGKVPMPIAQQAGNSRDRVVMPPFFLPKATKTFKVSVAQPLDSNVIWPGCKLVVQGGVVLPPVELLRDFAASLADSIENAREMSSEIGAAASLDAKYAAVEGIPEALRLRSVTKMGECSQLVRRASRILAKDPARRTPSDLGVLDEILGEGFAEAQVALDPLVLCPVYGRTYVTTNAATFCSSNGAATPTAPSAYGGALGAALDEATELICLARSVYVGLPATQRCDESAPEAERALCSTALLAAAAKVDSYARRVEGDANKLSQFLKAEVARLGQRSDTTVDVINAILSDMATP